MPETPPPDRAQRPDARRARRARSPTRAPAPGRPLEPDALRRFRKCASPATAPGFTRARRSAAPAMVRLFSTVLRREPDGSHVLVTPVEKLSIEVEATAFRATRHDDGRRRRERAASRFALDSGDARDRRPRPSADRRRHRRRPLARASPSATGSRPSSPARSIMSSPRSRWPRATIRPASGRDGAFFPLDRRMSLVDRIACALRSAEPPLELLAGDLIEGSTASRCAKPRCWSPSPTGPSPA